MLGRFNYNHFMIDLIFKSGRGGTVRSERPISSSKRTVFGRVNKTRANKIMPYALSHFETFEKYPACHSERGIKQVMNVSSM